MKKINVRAAALVLVIAACFFGVALVQGKPTGKALEGKAPRIVIEKDTVQIGEIFEVQDIEYTFKIKNAGGSDLQILGVHPGCGCSVADFDKVIPPGQEGRVHAKIFGRQISPGELAKDFTVTTNDPQRAEFTLTVMGKVKQVFEFSRELRWAGFADEDPKLDCVITNLLETPINILGARWADEGDVKELEEKIGLKIETIEKGRKYRLKTWQKGNFQPSNIAGSIVLTTDFPKLKERLASVAITIMGDVELHPQKLYYGEFAVSRGATKTFERTFDVIAARGDSLKIIKAVPDRDDITVKIRELKPGKLYRGTVMVRPSSKPGPYAGSIKIYTNYAKCKQLDLGIVGSVPGARTAESASKGKK
jgi:hypothetical protein